MATYRMRTDIIFDEGGKQFTVYGIDAFDHLGNVVKSIPDIFFSKNQAQDFINLCNSLNLSLLHLMNCIEDTMP